MESVQVLEPRQEPVRLNEPQVKLLAATAAAPMVAAATAVALTVTVASAARPTVMAAPIVVVAAATPTTPTTAAVTVDRERMCKLLYPHALRAWQENRLSPAELYAAIAATAEGYSFPTNLDRDPPINGLAPETQAAFFRRALAEGVDEPAFADRLNQMSKARGA